MATNTADLFRGASGEASIKDQLLGWARDSSRARDRADVGRLIAARTRPGMWIRREDLRGISWLDDGALEMTLFGLWRRRFLFRKPVTRPHTTANRVRLQAGETIYAFTDAGRRWANTLGGIHPPPRWLDVPPWIVGSRR